MTSRISQREARRLRKRVTEAEGFAFFCWYRLVQPKSLVCPDANWVIWWEAGLR